MKIEAEGVGKRMNLFLGFSFSCYGATHLLLVVTLYFNLHETLFFSKNHSTTKPNSQRKAVTHSGSSGGQLTQNKEWKISYGVQTSALLTTYVHNPLTVLRAYNHRNRSSTLF
jgi:hypothetical protein